MNKAFIKEDDLDSSVQFEESLGSGPRYITPEGFRHLSIECQELENHLRPAQMAAVDALKALPAPTREQLLDLEAEQRAFTTLDRRFRFLSILLKRLTVVNPQRSDRAFFGAYVTVEDEDGNATTYRLVGPDEVDASLNYISIDSPVGRAVLGHRSGDATPVRRPGQDDENLFLVDVEYR